MTIERTDRTEAPVRTWGGIAGIAGIALLALAVPAALLLAHDDEEHHGNPGDPFEGPGWTAGDGLPPPIQFPSSGVQLLAWLPVTAFGAYTSANSCYGYVSPSGREYAIIGLSHGTGFVDITDPVNPQIVGVVPGPASTWRDMKTYQHYCYCVSEGGGGIQVIDLSQIDEGILTHLGFETEGGSKDTTATHTVAVDEVSGYLYRAGGGGGTIGIRMYSLADPANPAFVGEWHDRYVHETQVVTYTEGPYAGRQIAFLCANDVSNSGNPRLDILDLTDKANPFVVGEATYSWPAYSHQAWLTEDRKYAYVNDELAELHHGIPTTTRIIDVSDIENPLEAGTFTNGHTSSGHNLYIRGDRLFASNYRSGLRVWDISEPLAPIEVAYFDTEPASDAPGFTSLWDNYPFFPSEIVIGSDIQKGLFIWHIGDAPLEFSYPEGLPETIPPTGGSFTVRIESAPGSDISLVPGTAKLHYNLHDGGGYLNVDLVHLGGDDYLAQIPPLDCTTTISFYLAAESAGADFNYIVRDPPTAPTLGFQAIIAFDVAEVFADDFDEDLGWVVGAPDDDATAGIWERVWPVGTIAQPSGPLVGSACYVTGQHPGKGGAGANDVDDGKTTLLSPLFSMSGMDNPTVSYYRWYSNSAGANPFNDVFVVDISPDAGQSWVNLETVGPAGLEVMGGWYFAQFNAADFIELTDQVQLRFVASDYDPQALVEAAIDKFRIHDVSCASTAPQCPGDLTGSGSVGVPDLLLLLSCWGLIEPGGACESADLTQSGSVGVPDLLQLLSEWGPCP